MAEFIPKRKNNDELKKFMEYYVSNLKSTLEFEVRFGTISNKPILKDDVDNIIKKLLSEGFKITKNNNYKLNIVNEFIDTSSGEVKKGSNIRTEIKGINNIKKYCKTNVLNDNMNYVFTQKNNIKINGVFNPYNIQKFDLRYSLQEEKNLPQDLGIIQTLKNSWTDFKKTFRLINRIELEHPHYPFRIDISSVKTSPVKIIKRDGQKNKFEYIYKDTIEESNVFNNKQHYEVEMELLYDKVRDLTGKLNKEKSISFMEYYIKRGIKTVLSGIQQSNFPIDKYEKIKIINEYQKLIGLKERPYIDVKKFIGPSSFTLQKENLIENDILKTPNVLNDYTVTEKADGIRKMLYISKHGKIYFIDMNMNIQYTGIKSKNSNLYESLFDGEHVLYNKNGDFINLYLCFDCYFLQKKDIRERPFINSIQDDKETYRLNCSLNSINNLKKDFESPKYNYNLKIEHKDFYLTRDGMNIFDCCRELLTKINNQHYPYETDGIIFTPQLIGVGINLTDEYKKIKNYKSSWKHSFKWKPPEFNTIDFLVETKKENKTEIISIRHEDGINLSKSHQSEYKTLLLKVGYNKSKKRGQSDGYVNPQLNIIQGKDDDIQYVENNGDNLEKEEDNTYYPGLFYPTGPYDNLAHICNVEMKMTPNGENEILTEEGEVIEDNTIVEFKYIKENKEKWRWVPLRVRYDKTNELRVNKNNFGNAYRVANNNWQSIHNPITEEMLSTGKGIFLNSSDDDVYYVKNKDDTKYTKSMREFHNLFVKRLLIQVYVKEDTKLFDFSVGKGGDFPKWIYSKIKFVMGVDIKRDNIENKLDGVCARYLNYKKKNKIMPKVMFLHADSSKDLLQGKSYFDDRSINIQNAILGIGPKDKKLLGDGVYNLYGIASQMFDITSIQFSMHYMFENNTTLHTFIKNVSNFTKVNGHFIGTCFDGKKIFKYLNTIEKDNSKNIFIKDKNGSMKKINSIIKQYDSDIFEDDASCIGYPIDVYQDSINQYIREYLVNFEYFTKIMETYGFILTENPFIEDKQESIGGFEELYLLLLQKYKDKKEYEDILDMSDEEKTISFMNNYFIYRKVRDVDVESIYNMYIKKYGDRDVEPGEINENNESIPKPEPVEPEPEPIEPKLEVIPGNQEQDEEPSVLEQLQSTGTKVLKKKKSKRVRKEASEQDEEPSILEQLKSTKVAKKKKSKKSKKTTDE